MIELALLVGLGTVGYVLANQQPVAPHEHFTIPNFMSGTAEDKEEAEVE